MGIVVGWNIFGIKKLKYFYYSEIRSVKLHKGGFSKGIIFETNSEKFIFWTNRTCELLEIFETKQVLITDPNKQKI